MQTTCTQKKSQILSILFGSNSTNSSDHAGSKGLSYLWIFVTQVEIILTLVALNATVMFG